MKASLSILLTLVSLVAVAQDLESKPFVCTPEIQPTFPGGFDSLRSFLSKNLIYPKRNAVSEDIVVIEFVVNIDGSLSNLKVVKGSCERCNKSALDVFSKMPKWIPGREADKPKAMKMLYPIKFKLRD